MSMTSEASNSGHEKNEQVIRRWLRHALDLTVRDSLELHVPL